MDDHLLPEAFTRRQALDRGVSDARLRTLVARGRLTRDCGHYVAAYLETPKVPRHLAEARAALDRFATGYAVSHLSAALAFGLPAPLGRPGPVHLTAVHATQRSRRPRGVVLHHSDSGVTPVTEQAGLVVTTLPRTLADCLRVLGPRVSVPLVDDALHRALVTPDEIRGALAAQVRWRGKPQARRSLALVDGRRESWLESYGCVRFAQWGLGLPEPQLVVRDRFDHFVARVDGGWVEDCTVVEFDGRAKYDLTPGVPGESGMPGEPAPDPHAAFFREKSRHNDLANTGLSVVRCELGDLLDRPTAVQRSVRAARATGRLARFTGSFHPTPATGLTFL